MKLIEEFEEIYGNGKTTRILSNAGHYSFEKLPVDVSDNERLIFALFEILDFQCYKYNKYCDPKIPENKIKELLLKHKGEIELANVPPPSFLGLFRGVFDFIYESE